MKRYEDKTTPESKKIWDLESAKPNFLNVNQDGTLPTNLINKLPENSLTPSDYIDDNKQRYFIKKDGKIYSSDITITET